MIFASISAKILVFANGITIFCKKTKKTSKSAPVKRKPNPSHFRATPEPLPSHFRATSEPLPSHPSHFRAIFDPFLSCQRLTRTKIDILWLQREKARSFANFDNKKCEFDSFHVS